MPEIRDAVYGDIFLTETEARIIDTPEFQRLRRLYQLPMVHYVFPGATHTRFAHSLGVLHLASEIAKNIKREITQDEMRYLKIAALLDDIAEPPFYLVFRESREGEIFRRLEWELKQEAVRRICERVNRSVKEKLDPEIILSIMEAQNPTYDYYFLNQIIASELGADKIDYLHRDSYMCGVTYGLVDFRILHEFQLEGNELVLKKEAIPLADSIFHSLFRMKYNVYDHKMARSSVCLVKKAFEIALNKRRESLENFLKELMVLDDFEFLQTLEKIEDRSNYQFIKRLKNRDFFKLAYSIEAFSLKDILIAEHINNMKDKKSEIETEISQRTQCPVYLDFIPIKSVPTTPLDVRINADKRSLSESPILKGWYGEKSMEQWKLFIFSEPEDKEKVTEICDDYFGYFEIGRKTLPKKPLKIFGDLYRFIEQKEISKDIQMTLRNKILKLSSNELRTLRILVEEGKATATEISKVSGRQRATESALLNLLVDKELVSKENLGKSVVFAPNPIVSDLIRKWALPLN